MANVEFNFGETEEVERNKVVIRNLEKVKNAILVKVFDEDHTLGNLIKSELLADQRVTFAGYRQPHPLEPSIELKVQTTEDEQFPPVVALDEAIENAENRLRNLQEQFENALPQRDPNAGFL